MKFRVERATDEFGTEWTEIDEIDVSGDEPDARAVEQLATESGRYRVSAVEDPETPATLFIVNAAGKAERRETF